MNFYTLNTTTGEMLRDDERGQYAKREELLKLIVQCNVCKRTIGGYELEGEAYPYRPIL